MIEVLKWNVEILDIKLIEAHALQIINWDVSSNDSYWFLNFYLNIYIWIFPIKENLWQFISNCTSLLNETIDNFEIYQFNWDIVALSIIWFWILNEYEQTDESEYLIKIAKRCLQYWTSEFFNWWIWISQQIQDKEELRSIIRPTLIEFLYFLSSDDSSDDELITLKVILLNNIFSFIIVLARENVEQIRLKKNLQIIISYTQAKTKILTPKYLT